MSEKRKDSRGRILRTGESQRKDGTYMYRYIDTRRNREAVYASTLEELRAKEMSIQHDMEDGIDYAAGKVTILQLAERYIAQKTGVRYSTKMGYNFVVNLLKKEDFSYRRISTVKPSDAKAFAIKLHKDGRSHSAIARTWTVLKPAFGVAVDDDIVRKNPFDFRLSDVIPNDTVHREALTPEQKEKYLAYVLSDQCHRRHYDEIVILLGTGMRVSEMYGLTFSDLDFEKRRLHVAKQLSRTQHSEYYVERPKTKSGDRYIPMTDEVYDAFQRVIAERPKPKVEMMIDGCTGFLFLDKDKKPKVALHLQHAMQWIIKEYNKKHSEQLPRITPHVLRHTFCTEMALSNMNLKNLQYLMGHSDAATTLNIYSHNNYEAAERDMARVVGQEYGAGQSGAGDTK